MQKTIARPMDCSGIGVHSGADARMTLKPAPADTGVLFIRTDVTDKDNMIKARWDNVVNTRLCTVLGNADGVTISTVEHLLAAFRGMGIDNAIVEIDGPEIPIMDGSSEPFVFLIECAGTQSLIAPKKAIKITREIVYTEEDKQASLTPLSAARYSFDLDYTGTAVGEQSHEVQLMNGTFKDQISRARTFGFLHEVELLRKNGLALGGSLDNAIVIDGEKILNRGGLRYRDEFVRHKILDAIGDLFLAGMPILGHFHGVRAGHDMNNKLLRTLFSQPDSFDIVTLPDSFEQHRDIADRVLAAAE